MEEQSFSGIGFHRFRLFLWLTHSISRNLLTYSCSTHTPELPDTIHTGLCVSQVTLLSMLYFWMSTVMYCDHNTPVFPNRCSCKTVVPNRHILSGHSFPSSKLVWPLWCHSVSNGSQDLHISLSNSCASCTEYVKVILRQDFHTLKISHMMPGCLGRS